MASEIETLEPCKIQTTGLGSILGRCPVFDAEIQYVKTAEDGTMPQFPAIKPRDPQFLDARKVVVGDMRDCERTFSLARDGFQMITHHFPSGIDFKNDEQIRATVYPELNGFLKNSLGAQKVTTIHHRIRDQPHFTGGKGRRAPAIHPHADVTRVYAPSAMEQIWPELSADKSQNHHWQMVNAWRPIKRVLQSPLAVLEPSSVSTDDFLTVKYSTDTSHLGKVRVEAWFITAPPAKSLGSDTAKSQDGGHKWWYISEQEPHEILLFNQYDSVEAGPAAVPHCSFQMADVNEHVRESIEFRILILW